MIETINNITENIENIYKNKKKIKIDESKENKKIQILLEKEKYRYEECHGGC